MLNSIFTDNAALVFNGISLMVSRHPHVFGYWKKTGSSGNRFSQLDNGAGPGSPGDCGSQFVLLRRFPLKRLFASFGQTLYLDFKAVDSSFESFFVRFFESFQGELEPAPEASETVIGNCSGAFHIETSHEGSEQRGWGYRDRNNCSGTHISTSLGTRWQNDLARRDRS